MIKIANHLKVDKIKTIAYGIMENTFRIAKSFASLLNPFTSRKYSGGFVSPPSICNMSLIGKLISVNVKNSLIFAIT